MFAEGRMVLRLFLGSHGTLVAVSTQLMLPLRDSDIPMNVPLTFHNKQPLPPERTSDQRQNYRERGEYRARAQHGVLVKRLEKVAGKADGENGGWKIKLIVFVGGTC
jgi:hypothetical protein